MPDKVPTYIQQVLDDAQLKAIGRVAAEWSYFESILELGIWGMAGIDPKYRRALTTELSAIERLKIFSALAHQRLAEDHEAISELDALTGKVHALNTRRNDVIHAEWLVPDDPDLMKGERWKFTSKGPKHIKRYDLFPVLTTATEIEKLADEIWDLRLTVVGLMTTFAGVPKNLRQDNSST